MQNNEGFQEQEVGTMIRIHSAVMEQCEELRHFLEHDVMNRRCLDDSEGGCLSHLSRALEAFPDMKHDGVLNVCSCILVHRMKLSPRDIVNGVYLTIARYQKLYGDSLNNPVRCFSDGDVMDHIDLKLDDRLCIVYNSRKPVESDVYIDIVSLIILHRIMSGIMSGEYIVTRRSLEDMAGKLALLFVSVLLTCILWSSVYYIIRSSPESFDMSACFFISALLITGLSFTKRSEVKKDKK